MTSMSFLCTTDYERGWMARFGSLVEEGRNGGSSDKHE